MRRHIALLALACAALLVVAGCGSSKKTSSNTTSTKTTAPAAANRQLTLPKASQPATASGKATAANVTAAPLSFGKPTRRAALKGLGGKSVADKLALFAGDAGAFWQQVFTKAKLKFEPATVNVIASQQSIGCNPPGTVKSTDAPVYCVADSSIDLPVDSLSKLDQDPKFSDAGVLALVGFYWGLHVENQAGLFKKQGITGAKITQGALCLDGIYVSSVGQRNLLDTGDLDKIANIVAAGGDAPGTPTDKGVGSPSELVNAFNTGLSGKKCTLG
ncbi:MAG: neutral zinc metallopeptidase [Actinomycetota bacterium]|nr:neutral zinc metallopeptidase [Actinomycetota bacterium]